MLRISVLGCGRIGQMHARNIARHPRAVLASVYDLHAPAAETLARSLGVCAAASAEQVFAAPDVDAVLIASATDTQCDYLEQGAAAGKPMLCEKPIDLRLARVDRCAAALASASVPIMLGFVRRFDPGHRALRDAIVRGEIGALRQIVITSRDPALASEAYLAVSGGIFRDMTIHDFDMARFLLGEEPVAVSAVGSRLIDPALMARLDDYDSVSVTLRTADGKLCLITNSREASYGYDQRVEALGAAGMALSDNHRVHRMALSGDGYSARAAALPHFFIERYAEAFAAEITAFVDMVENGAAPEVGFEDGRRAQRLAEAAVRSAAERRVVEVAELG